MGEVKLFRTRSSPFALRIVWALKHKGVEFENVYEDVANKSPELLEYNPVHKKVPVLLHDGKPICESLVILEYVDETWKDAAPLLPADPLERAAARFWAKFNDEQVLLSVFHYLVRKGTKQEEARETALENLKLVEELLNGKNFFGGETLGFLDLCFGWLASYYGVIEESTGLRLIDKGQFPNIHAWRNKFCGIPLIRENWPDEKKLMARFKEVRQAYGTAN